MILGDAGINYYLDDRDVSLKEELSQLPITLFCVHGNHEERPYKLPNYQEKLWHNGIVLYERNYPNILFAQDGEIYHFDGKKAIVIGGAYSIDKYFRISGGAPWFESEQPDDQIKDFVESQLDKADWRVDYVFSHTAPLSFEPRESFLDSIDQDKVDKSTEEWLDIIERKLNYQQWFCGHYHLDWSIGKIQVVYEDFIPLNEEWD